MVPPVIPVTRPGGWASNGSSVTVASTWLKPRTLTSKLYQDSVRFQYSGSSLDASWTRSATLIVPAWLVVRPLERAPRTSVRKPQSGSVSIALWIASTPPPLRVVGLEGGLLVGVEGVVRVREEDHRAEARQVLLGELGGVAVGLDGEPIGLAEVLDRLDRGSGQARRRAPGKDVDPVLRLVVSGAASAAGTNRTEPTSATKLAIPIALRIETSSHRALCGWLPGQRVISPRPLAGEPGRPVLDRPGRVLVLCDQAVSRGG